MKLDQTFQRLFLSSFLSILFSSGDVFAYKESDFYKLKNTKKCIECDLTDLNLSRLNLRRVNLSGSDLSGSDLSGSDLSGSNLSGVNLSRVNLSGTNLKNINLTGTNLNRIIIDIKTLSTLDLSESTFLNKSTLAEEEKKKKEQELRKKKKDQELKKKKEQELRKKKKEQELKKKKEQELREKKEQELKKKIEEALKKKKEIGLSNKKEQAPLKQEADKKFVLVQSDEKCYVAVQSTIDFEPSLLSIISISLISKFVSEVEQVPPGGISADSCQYQISVTKINDTTFVTFRGEGLNSSGDSKLSGLDGFQQSILKSIYRSFKNKRSLICQDYATSLEECGEIKIKKRQSGALLGTWEKSMLKMSLA
ncbi:pentapeptide repeat-containing protein [Deltaproteobacteria bacterium]|nr:pentapeptide repeat-containing protein [Deltaproteobacteria bacterium]